MEDGQISEMGPYLELMDRKGAFAKYIHTFSINQRKESAILRDKSKKSKWIIRLIKAKKLTETEFKVLKLFAGFMVAFFCV